MAAIRRAAVLRDNPSLSRLWWGLVFLAAGVIGILAVADVVDWNRTVGVWWPVALVGWAAAEMINSRRLTVTGSVIVAIGLAMLADNLDWPVRGLVWSALFLGVGVAILWGARPRDARSRHLCVDCRRRPAGRHPGRGAGSDGPR
jgi:hypothetical protein